VTLGKHRKGESTENAPGHSAEVRGWKVTLKPIRRRKSSIDDPWKSGHFIEEG